MGYGTAGNPWRNDFSKHLNLHLNAKMLSKIFGSEVT